MDCFEDTGWLATSLSALVTYTAFTSRKGRAVAARLIVRDLNKKAALWQAELVTVSRYHTVFSDSAFVMLQAEEHNRGHCGSSVEAADCMDGVTRDVKKIAEHLDDEDAGDSLRLGSPCICRR